MPHINHRRGETRRSVNREVKCSCEMCRNPRRSAWGPALTLQERKALEAERLERRWPSGRKDKPYTIEYCSGSGDYKPEESHWMAGWRRYRTEAARDEALRVLQAKAEAEGKWRALRHFYRAGPND